MLEWLRSFLNELQVPQHPTLVHEDNEAAIKLAQGLSFSATSRHIVVRYSRVREIVQDQLVRLKYVPTRSQLADGLTKNLPLPNFIRHLPHLLGFTPTDLRLARIPYQEIYQKFITQSRTHS